MTRLDIYHLGQRYVELYRQPATVERNRELKRILAIFEEYRKGLKEKEA